MPKHYPPAGIWTIPTAHRPAGRRRDQGKVSGPRQEVLSDVVGHGGVSGMPRRYGWLAQPVGLGAAARAQDPHDVSTTTPRPATRIRQPTTIALTSEPFTATSPAFARLAGLAKQPTRTPAAGKTGDNAKNSPRRSDQE